MPRGPKPAKDKVESTPRLGRKSPKDDASRVRDLEKRLEEALRREAEAVKRHSEGREQHAATAEILRVISISPSDLQPVFDTIVERAVRLCDARLGALLRFDGQMIHLAAHAQQADAESVQALQTMYPRAANTTSVSGRALLWGRPVHVHNMREDPELAQVPTAQVGHRTVLSVPMMRERSPIGAITVARAHLEPFSDTQIALLKTFADQAVIAIENVRLFTELQQKNEALTQAHAQITEALEQQTATSEILRVISSSPTDVQPVFDVIVGQACRLCDAVFANAVRLDGELMHNMAAFGFPPEVQAVIARDFPMRPSRASMSGRAILERAMVMAEDASIDDVGATSRDMTRLLGGRAMFSVPMLRDGVAVGAITLARRERGSFPERQVNLLRSFANQAVIALENVRRFTELQTSNHELTSALDTQTATRDIRRVISRSQTDVQPACDAIVTSAVRLLRGSTSVVTRVSGDQIDLAAFTSINTAGEAAVRATYPQSLGSDWHAAAFHSRAPINIADAHTDSRWPEAVRAYARTRGWRSGAVVPLLDHDEAIGTIGVGRQDAGGFTDDEIALLQTFADQAVIAIENARLLTELQSRTQELTRS